MRATFIAYDGVNLVKNQCARSLQHAPTAFACQKDVKRLGRGYHDVRRPPGHRSPLRRRCVTSSDERAYLNLRQVHRLKFRNNSCKRILQVALNVVAKGL